MVDDLTLCFFPVLDDGCKALNGNMRSLCKIKCGELHIRYTRV